MLRLLPCVFVLACDDAGADGAETGDTGDPAGGHCLVGPSVAITSPQSGVTLPVGVAVALEADASSEVDDATELRVLWAVVPNGGEADNVGVGLSQTWVPEAAGIWSILVQVEDSCTDDVAYDLQPVQDDVRVEVE